MEDWQIMAQQEASMEREQEVCGLVINVKGKKIFKRCRNISRLSDQFILSPQDYAICEESGQILAVFHSHPNGSSEPSEADRISCEGSKLPWYIYSPLVKTWHQIYPTGYKPSLYGRPWVWGLTDCFSFVNDWYKELKNIDLKKVERPSSLEEFLEDPLFDQKVKNFFEHLDFKPLKDNATLQKGDVVSMRLMHHKPSHVAVFVGNGEIAHHSNNRLSCREAYSGYYLSCTEKRYRYAY